MKRTIAVIVFWGMLFCLPSVNLQAQNTASLLGTVHDTTGAIIPGAQLTILDQRTGTTRSTITDSAGHYLVPFLPVGEYTIAVTYQGFGRVEQKDITLQIGEAREVDFTLTPAAVRQTVEVSAVRPVAVDVTSATLSQVINSQQVSDLPLNGRNFVELAVLTPGTISSYSGSDSFNGTAGAETAIKGSFSLSVGGSREDSTDFRLDGIDNNELTGGGITILPSIDAIQEFKVLTYNYSPEYGRRGGPTVLVTLKSGTDQFHGTAFDFLRNNDLDARSFFATTTPKYIQNQFGFSFGGPIQKDKTFFFFDYQDLIYHEAIPYLAQVPTLHMREGVFDESFPGIPAPQIFNPATTTMVNGQPVRQPFANNTILPCQPGDPAGSCITPIAQAMMNLWPLPNVPGTLAGDYVSEPVQTFAEPKVDLKLDRTFSSKDTASAHFSYDQPRMYEPCGLPGFGDQPGGYVDNRTLTNHGRNVGLSETHTFSPTLVNQVTLGYNRQFDFITAYGTGSNESEKLGIPGSNLGTNVSSDMLDTLLTEGFWGFDGSFAPFQGGTDTYQASDALEYVFGNHSLQMGGGFWDMQMNIMTAANGQGYMNFTGEFTGGFVNGSLNPVTGSPVADLLVGIPTNGEHDQTFQGVTRGDRWKEFRPYIEDNWRIRRNLTLDLGLAYNYTTTMTEAHNRTSNFDTATGNFLIPGVNSGASVGVNPDTTEFEPRIGFAWSPRGSSKTAIRGGYGIFHDSGWNQGSQGIWENPPYFGTYAFYADGVTPITSLSQGFPILSQISPQSLLSSPDIGGNTYTKPFNFPLGMIEQWNLNVQRELPGGVLLTTGYAASRSEHLTTDYFNLNASTPGPLATYASRLPFPAFTWVIGVLPRGQSRYDSLEVKAETRKVHHGLYVLVAYTYSKGIDNGLGDNWGTPVGITYFPLQVPHGTDKGLNEVNLAQQFTGSFTYNLPFGQGRMWGSKLHGIAQTLVGGWQMNGILHFTSGYPLLLSTSIDNSGTTLGNRPDRVCNGALGNPTVSEWFNTNCFVNPVPGVLGNSSRTPLFGPGFSNVDVSVFKKFPLPWREGMSLQFRVEAFNLANTPQFGTPGTAVGAANFGEVTSTVNNPRLIQFALKLIF